LSAIEIKIKKEAGYTDLPLPHYQTTGSAGLDLYAAVDNSVIVEPGGIDLVSTGIRIAVPAGYEGQIRPRSGLSLKHGIGVLNSPGTIDSDYRGVVRVILFNFSKERFTIRRGDRIAQLVIAKYERIRFTESDKLDESHRNAGGFGSTGSN